MKSYFPPKNIPGWAVSELLDQRGQKARNLIPLLLVTMFPLLPDAHHSQGHEGTSLTQRVAS